MIKVTKSGKWKAIIRRPALGVPLKVMTWTHKADAEGWARKVESEIERGVWKDNAAAEAMTLAEALDKYRDEKVLDKAREGTPKHAALSRKRRGELSIIKMLRKEKETTLPLARFNSVHVDAMQERWAAYLKPNSIHRRFHTLSHLFTVAAAKWGMKTLTNPVREVELPPQDDARDRRVSDDELDAIRAAGADTRHLPAFVTLAVETACRRAELVNLEWRDVRSEGDEPTLHVRKSKNGTARDVPLTVAAVETLQAFPHHKDGGNSRVFAEWASEHSATRSFVRAVRRARKQYETACEKAGSEPDDAFLTGIRLHDLRHEAMSRLSDLYGFGPHELAKIAGQKTLRMVMRYYHPKAQSFAKRMRAHAPLATPPRASVTRVSHARGAATG